MATLKQQQIQLLRGVHDRLYVLYGDNASIPIGHDTHDVDVALDYAKGLADTKAEWRLYLVVVHRESMYGHRPTICALNRVRRMGFERAGPCVLRGSFDEVWPAFEAHVRML